MKENSNCITNENFNNVVKKIISHSSKIKITSNNEEYEVFYINKENELVFKQNNWSIGKITSNLVVFAFAKRQKDNNNQKLIINQIFCDLFD